VYLKNWTPTRDFQLQPCQDEKPWTKELIKDWETDKAAEVARNPVAWGPNFNDDASTGPLRGDPWHANLDNTIFWMREGLRRGEIR
jgi:hypothetical protein